MEVEVPHHVPRMLNAEYNLGTKGGPSDVKTIDGWSLTAALVECYCLHL